MRLLCDYCKIARLKGMRSGDRRNVVNAGYFEKCVLFALHCPNSRGSRRKTANPINRVRSQRGLFRKKMCFVFALHCPNSRGSRRKTANPIEINDFFTIYYNNTLILMVPVNLHQMYRPTCLVHFTQVKIAQRHELLELGSLVTPSELSRQMEKSVSTRASKGFARSLLPLFPGSPASRRYKGEHTWDQK